MAASSCTTRNLADDVSAFSARHSRVKSSTRAKMRRWQPVGEGVRIGNRGSSAGSALQDRHWRPRAERSLAPAPPAHLQLFLTIEAAELHVVHDQALAAHLNEQAAMADPEADRG